MICANFQVDWIIFDMKVTDGFVPTPCHSANALPVGTLCAICYDRILNPASALNTWLQSMHYALFNDVLIILIRSGFIAHHAAEVEMFWLAVFASRLAEMSVSALQIH